MIDKLMSGGALRASLCAGLCMVIFASVPVVRSAIVADTMIKCSYDVDGELPKPIGRGEFITITQVADDTHIDFIRLPELLPAENTNTPGVATLETRRKIIFYQTGIEQAREVMRTDDSYYTQLIGYRDALGYLAYDETLACE